MMPLAVYTRIQEVYRQHTCIRVYMYTREKQLGTPNTPSVKFAILTISASEGPRRLVLFVP